MPRIIAACLVFALLLAACSDEPARESLEVTATAYTSDPAQTQGDPFVGAWNQRLKPGMKAIAVSRDLLKMGLGKNTPVKIEGLEGVYRVKDKMNARWKKKIDIYFGLDKEAAREFGKRKLTITWPTEEAGK